MTEPRRAFNYQILCYPGTTTLEVTEAIEKFMSQYPQAKTIEIHINIETSQNKGFVAEYGIKYESVANIRLVAG